MECNSFRRNILFDCELRFASSPRNCFVSLHLCFYLTLISKLMSSLVKIHLRIKKSRSKIFSTNIKGASFLATVIIYSYRNRLLGISNGLLSKKVLNTYSVVSIKRRGCNKQTGLSKNFI